VIKNRFGRSAVLFSLALVILALCLFKPASHRSVVSMASQAWAQEMEGALPVTNRQSPSQAITQNWPSLSRKIAAVMVEKYGQPDDYDDNNLTWYDNGPWKRTIVHREGYRNQHMGGPDTVLQQSVNYRVPSGKFKDLEQFDPRLSPNRPRNELSMSSESEQINFLAINLADEIIVGWKSADEARSSYTRISTLAKFGKSSPYMEGLRFQADK
jgi:hypothetical protein